MYRHLLVPIDDSPLSASTVEQAIAYAKATGARLTFLHARPDIGARGDGALLHAMAPEVYGAAADGKASTIVAKAEAAARMQKVACATRVETNDRPHEAILDAVRSCGCDLIFMASHGRRGLKAAVVGSVTRHVLEGATVPVLVHAVERNLGPRSDEQRAVAIIHDEHRSLAAVLHGLLELAARAEQDPAAADRRLLGAMVFYIDQFPERLHHPKENAYLFRKLRARAPVHDELIRGLESEHEAGAAVFIEMRAALAADDLSAFAARVRAFADLQWRHMSAEERLVLPAASAALTAEDWLEIAGAFGANGDPRFGAGESFATLAGRLLALADRARGAST